MEIVSIQMSQEIEDFVAKNHYTGCCVKACRFCVGLFDEDILVGVAVFSDSTRPNKKYEGMLELSRFVVDDRLEHNSESFFLSRSLEILEENFPCNGVFTYADKTEGHQGTIYKACNFLRIGETAKSYHYLSKSSERIDKRQVWERAVENKRHEAVQAYIEELERIEEEPKLIFIYEFKRKIPTYLSPTFVSWTQMKYRCLNEKYHQFRDYGGRGITICEEWMSFDNFLRDMGARPSMMHSLDRINNEGNYCRDNCRWSSYFEQNRNTRRNVLIEYNGVKKCLTDWSIETGINFQTLSSRLRAGVVPPELFSPSNRKHLASPAPSQCKVCGIEVYSIKNQLCKAHYKRRERELAAQKNGRGEIEVRDGRYKKLKDTVLSLEVKIRFEPKMRKSIDYGIYFSNQHQKWAAFVYAENNGKWEKVSFIQFKEKADACNFRNALKDRYTEKYPSS